MDNRKGSCSFFGSALGKSCLCLALLLPAKAQAYFTFFEKCAMPEGLPGEIMGTILGSGLSPDKRLFFKQYLCLLPRERKIVYDFPPASTEPKYLQAIKIFGKNVQFQDPSNDQLVPKDSPLCQMEVRLAALKRKGNWEGFALKRFGSQQRPGSLELRADWGNVKSFWSAIYATVIGNGGGEVNVWILVQTEIILCPPPQYLTCFLERLNPDWRIQNVPGDGYCGFWSAITSMINIDDHRFARQEGEEYFADDLDQVRALREGIYEPMKEDFLGDQQTFFQGLAPEHSLKAMRQHVMEGASFQGVSAPSPFWLWQEDFPYLARATGHPVLVVAFTEDGHSVTFNVSLADGRRVDIRDIGSLRACIRANPGFIKMFHSGNHYQAIIRFR